MKQDATTLFEEIAQYHYASLNTRSRYAKLYALLDRATKELTVGFAAEYTSLFARLHALCQHRQYTKATPIELFRYNAKRVQTHEYQPEKADYLYDLKALCEFISFFYQTPVPVGLRKLLPDGWRTFGQPQQRGEQVDKIRFVVERWDEHYLYGHDEAKPEQEPLQVDYHVSKGVFDALPNQIQVGCQLNLLSVRIEPTTIEDKNRSFLTLYPEIIVLEPDFLIDVSTLSACLQSYGSSPRNYLIKKLMPNHATRHILLGNAANQFIDDCVNETEAQPVSFRESIQHNFRDYLLDYSVCEEVNNDYFNDAQQQFENIRQTVSDKFGDASVDVKKSGALLEPSFFCEPLGLQGRMDLMLNDFSRIIELKSGKAEEFGGPLRGKNEHRLQMALYKEMLYFGLHQPREKVRTFLFYSRYPHLFEEPYAKGLIQRASALRNAIVQQERLLRDGQGLSLLKYLTLDELNEKQVHNKLWIQYQAPQLQSFLDAFSHLSDLEGDYFNAFLQFVEREQFLSKIGDDYPDSGRGFAETWNNDLLTKQANGNILIDLQIIAFIENKGIEKLRLQLPAHDEGFLPNFREGDYVILYERNSDNDLATNQLVHRCCIEEITSETLLLKLNFKQRNPIIFHSEGLYALEHDHMDSSFNAFYKGLYAFLLAPKERRDLLLMQRKPRVCQTVQPLHTCPTNEVIRNLVIQAKQVEDYLLLVGPPGTGKTSVALKAMVEEFYSSPTNEMLLLSYTNRAVDEICAMLDSISSQPPYLRIGGELTCEKSYRKHLVKMAADECNTRTDIINLFANRRIVVGTVASVSGQMDALFHLKHFDVAIIDEASQILEPHLLGLLSAQTSQHRSCIERFILIGDHKQLPAVVVQRPEYSIINNEQLNAIGLTDRRQSLFERLYTHQLTHPTKGITATLHKQGRMHPDVGQFANVHFYHGDLLPVPVKHQTQPLEFVKHGNDFQAFIATTRMGFIHCEAPQVIENNKTNSGEARIVAAIVGTISQLCACNHLPFNAAKRVGIIVPFRGQIAMIKHELSLLHLPETNQITIDTVERFQGSQRDIILFSTTISQPYQLDILSMPVLIEGQLVDRKLNVALTRAKKQIFVVGNAGLLSKHPLYKELIEWCNT